MNELIDQEPVDTELVQRETGQITPVNDATSMLSMIGQMATSPEVDIDKVERLMALQVQMQERENEGLFNQALTSAQQHMGSILKNQYNNHTKSSYADLGAIIKQITPIYTDCGINLSFNSGEIKDGCLPVICYVSARGHTRTYTYDSPITTTGTGGKVMMTDTHARGSAMSYGRRYLTCMIFNIATVDDDGNGATAKPEPEVISTDQALTIKTLMADKSVNEGRLVKWYNSQPLMKQRQKVSRLEDMLANCYERIINQIGAV